MSKPTKAEKVLANTLAQQEIQWLIEEPTSELTDSGNAAVTGKRYVAKYAAMSGKWAVWDDTVKSWHGMVVGTQSEVQVAVDSLNAENGVQS